MSGWKKPHSHSYYDYIYKYNSKFLTTYQSQSYWKNQRGSSFLEMLRLKAWRMKGNRNWMWFDVRYGNKFHTMLYIPLFFFVTFSYALTPAYRRLDERYHLRYGDGEDDDIEEVEPFVRYQSRKRPYTRRKYANAVKIVYDNAEDFDYASEQPLRYR